MQSVGRRDDFPRIVLQQTRELPFRRLNLSSAKDKAKHDRAVQLARELLCLNERFIAAKTAQAKVAVERQFAAADQRLDRLVYDLYGLTENEVRVIEQGDYPLNFAQAAAEVAATGAGLEEETNS
jgi:hypothetical protein